MRKKYQREYMYEIHTYLLTLFLLILLIPALTQAEPHWVSFYPEYPEGTPPILSTEENGIDETIIYVKIPGMWVEDVKENGQVFQKIEIPEYQTTFEIGRPAIPAIGEFVGFLEPSINSISFEDKDNITLENYLVYPFQTPEIREKYFNKPFDYDWEFYQQDNWYPKDRASVSDTKIMREVCLAETWIVPFEYNPYKRELIVHSNMVVEVYHKPDVSRYENWKRPVGADKDFVNMYRGLILNYDNLGLQETDTTNGYDYLIITPWIFSGEATAFKYYLEQYHGYSVQVLIRDTNYWYDIYQTIYDFYENNHNDYVLLYGDVAQMPIPYRDSPLPGYPDIPSDMVYACLEGNDVIPEVFVGRFSASTELEAQRYGAKVYDHYTYMNPGRILKCLLVAHSNWVWEGEHSIFSIYSDIISMFLYAVYHPEFTKLYGEWNWIYNKEVISEIEDGKMIVNYSGHGDVNEYDQNCWIQWNDPNGEWVDPEPQDFTQNNVLEINDGNQRPFVFNVSCFNGKIDWGVDDCLCEYWMNASGGACGTLGFSVSCWDPPVHTFNEYLFKILYGYVEPSGETICEGHIGIVDYMASLKMLEEYGYDNYSLTNHIANILLGDPSLYVLPAGGLTVESNENRKISSDVHKTNINSVEKTAITIYPNPVYDIMNIDITNAQPGNAEIKIYDILGRTIYNKKFSSSENVESIEVNIDELNVKPGVYIINIKAPGISAVRKIIYAPTNN
jgi:hypothetical protein